MRKLVFCCAGFWDQLNASEELAFFALDHSFASFGGLLPVYSLSRSNMDLDVSYYGNILFRSKLIELCVIMASG